MTKEQYIKYQNNVSKITDYQNAINSFNDQGLSVTIRRSTNETIPDVRKYRLVLPFHFHGTINDDVFNDTILQDLGEQVYMEMMLMLETKIKELEKANEDI